MSADATQALLSVTQPSKAAIARGAKIETTRSDFDMVEKVIENWCVKGDKRKTRQLIAEGIALARAEAADAAALLADANSYYSAGQLEEIARSKAHSLPGDVGDHAAIADKIIAAVKAGDDCRGRGKFEVMQILAALTPSALSGDAGEDTAQRLQDHMEQHHGVCLSASDWDAAIRAVLPSHQGAE